MRRRNFNKIVSIIIFILTISMVVLPCLSACGEKEKNSQNDQNVSSNTDANQTENNSADNADNKEKTEETKLQPDLPEKNFEGYEFTILSRVIDNADWTDWHPRDIYAEQENGELINDAVYKRNRTVEAKYNFVVKEIASKDFDNTAKKAIRAGDSVYDVIMPGYKDAFETYAQSGLLVDLLQADYLDFEKPWWNQAAPKELSISGKLYATFSDLLILHKDATEAMIFNKKLVADLGLESPYTLVNNGKWTMDKLLEFTKAGTRDLDTDGAMTVDDQFGLVAQLDSITSWVHGCGMTFGIKDSDDYPVDNFSGNQKLYNIIEKTFDLMYQDGTIDLHHYEGKFPIYEYQTKMFSENRGLVSWIRMRVVETLRSMETDFGILPLPKYDETQDKYYTYINPYTSCAIAVPKSCSDISRAGFILEALSAESKYVLQPAYYDLTLKGKYSRDDDSAEMLDIIFSNTNTVFDVMEIYGFGNFVRQYIDLFRKNSPSDFMSLYDKCESKIETDIKKCINNFTNISD